MIKDLLEHRLEIVKACEHKSPVYIVKLLIKHPFLGAIFAFERAIWWTCVTWLDQAQICTDYVGFGMFSGELHRPYARAGSNIKNIRGLSNRRDVQLLPEEELPPAMLKVWCMVSKDGAAMGVKDSGFLRDKNVPRRSCSSCTLGQLRFRRIILWQSSSYPIIRKQVFFR